MGARDEGSRIGRVLRRSRARARRCSNTLASLCLSSLFLSSARAAAARAGEMSGCGGRGDTQCGMIDLVAGRVSSVIMKQLKKNPSKPVDSNTVVDSNFFADAARVYITQRAINIDEYLGFQNEAGSDPTNLSAAIIKSDCTRVVGRESVRILLRRLSKEH